MSGLQRFIGMLDRAADQAAEAAQALDRPACPVEKWQFVLDHELTRSDRLESRREMRRGYTNIRRLPLLLEASSKVQAETQRGGNTEEAFRAALLRNFTFDRDPQTGEIVAPSILRRFWRMFLAGDCRSRP